MLRRNFILATATTFLASAKALATRKVVADSSADFEIIATPYLCGGGTDCVFVVFPVNKLSLADVYVWSDDDADFKEPVLFVESELTGRKHVGTIHNVKIDGLKNGKTYFYKVVAKEVIKYWNYRKSPKDKYGETVLGKTITLEKNVDGTPLKFTLPKTESKTLTFAMVNDLHENVGKINKLFKAFPNDNYDFLVVNGDTVNYMMEEERLFKRSVGVIAENLKGVKPVYYLRGNHETRGQTAEDYFKYFPTPTGKTYFAFKAGPAFFLFLDLCEDKPDSSKEGEYLNNYSKYRNEEVKWLREIVKLPEFKSAKYRIAIQHIPSVGEYLAYRSETDLHLSDVLKDANIDMALCGHLHRHCIFPKGSDARELYRTTEKLKAQLMRAVNAEDGKVHYPTVVNSHKEAMFVHISEENIKLEFFDMADKKSQPDFVYTASK